MKEYMKVLKKSMAENGKSDEEMKKWQDDATETVKQLLKIVKKCEIYLGLCLDNITRSSCNTHCPQPYCY